MEKMITSLGHNDVFVFGSNRGGIHGAGAARQARLQFGAEMGVGEGLTGQAYAFPTLDEHLQSVPLHDLVASRNLLYKTAREHPELIFLMTKVGCGLAGREESEMRALLSRPEEHADGVIVPYVDRPSNIILPEDWRS